MSERLPKRYLEPEIKVALIQYLLERGWIKDNSVLINELTLDQWARRADLVVVNGKFYVFEIKSDSDRLDRLQSQVESYLKYFDKVIVVVASKHVEEAQKLLPQHVAIWELVPQKDGLKFRILNRGREYVISNKEALLKLITAQEMRGLLRKNKLLKRGDRRSDMEGKLKEFPLRKIRKDICEIIKIRFKSSNDDFKESISKNGFDVSVLRELSLYRGRSVASPEAGFTSNDGLHAFGLSLSERSNVEYQQDVFQLWAHTCHIDEPFGPIPKHIRETLLHTED